MARLENTIDIVEEEAQEETNEGNSSKDKKNKRRDPVKGILEGSFMARNRVIRQLPFLIYLTALGLLYIFNSNLANRTVISINKTKKQIEEQRFEYVNTKSGLTKSSRQTEIAKSLEKIGIKESKTPARKILI